MQDKLKSGAMSPTDIAREAFRRLAVRRIVPTPEAYREIYEEIAGKGNQSNSAEKVLADFAEALSNASEAVSRRAGEFKRAADKRDWQEYSRHLADLVEVHLAKPEAVAAPVAPAAPDKDVNSGIAETADKKPVPSAQSASISLVDELPAPPAKPRSIQLVDDDNSLAARQKPVRGPAASPAVTESRQMQMLRDLLTRTLTLALGSLLRGAPALAEEAEALAIAIKEATTEAALNEISGRLKQLCFRIELKAEDLAEEHELLLKLFKLLLENVGELLEDDTWLSGQVATVQQMLIGPISHNALKDAERSLKEVIYKQGALKHSLAEAKATVKTMMMTFVDRLGAIASSTGNYHEKIDKYSQKISQAKDIGALNTILHDVMHDTKAAQIEALRSRDDMMVARQQVQEAEARIQELETQLEQLSELVREDQLTGSLNRRGLEDVFEREMARCERRKSPLCISMLDLDDFKRLNDTYGHAAGDEALIHLVRVIKETLRALDVIARFGGEEFLIVLPDTSLEDAVKTVTRVQRELTKQIFMYNQQRLLITFSAGVALRQPGEDATTLIKRADEALYEAKKAGKNRVIAAV
jgi:diguanylate cyclase